MGISTTRQANALVKRYLITLLRSPLSSLTRLVLWPGLLIGLCTYLLNKAKDSELAQNTRLEQFVPILLVLVTGFHVYSFAQWLVTDRSTGFKSLMISMGLRRRSYFIGNFMSFQLFLLPVVIAFAVICIRFVYIDTQASIVAMIIMFILYSIHLNGLAFVIGSIITSPSYVALIFILFLVESQLHSLLKLILRHTSEAWHPVMISLASLSPFESIRIFSISYRTCKNCDKTTFSEDELSQPTHLILLAMTIWTVAAFAFARWFYEVCPWQKDSATKSPLFCLNFWSSYRGQDIPNSDGHQEIGDGNPQFFESIRRDRDIGIRVDHVTKVYQTQPVVDDLSLNIYSGETTLLLGHNGAGKTTLMDMILYKVTPTKGVIKINNTKTGGERGIGVCPQASLLDDQLSVKQHLQLLLDIKTDDLNGHSRFQHIMQTLDDVNLTSHSDKLPSELSGGMKRKLSLAMAFVGHSNILILDEPSSGLDPDSRMFIWNAIRRYRADRTVLLSTQHMEEADYLGDRIAIMKGGKLVCCGSSSFLNRLFGTGYKLRIECCASKRKSILEFIRKYFQSARHSENDQTLEPIHGGKDPVMDMVIELSKDHEKDPELKLIKLLEDIEKNSVAHHILSHGLKSSSVEDVLLNTNKDPPTDHHVSASGGATREYRETTRLTLTSTNGHVAAMTKPLKAPSTGYISQQLCFMRALLRKQFNIYKRDWLSLIIYRLVLPLTTLYFSWYNYSMGHAFGTGFRSDPGLLLLIFHYIHYPTLERTMKFKTMQLTSDANYSIYWISQLLMDSFSVCIMAIADIVFLYYVFDGVFLESKTIVLSVAFMSTILFGIAGALLSYVLSNALSDTKTSMAYMILLFMLPVLVSLLWSILAVAGAKVPQAITRFTEKMFIAILPTEAYSYATYGLSSECYIHTKISIVPNYNTCEPSTDFSAVVFGLISLFCQICAYALILYLLERKNYDLSWYCRISNWFCWPMSSSSRTSSMSMRESRQIDSDVVNESTKAMRVVNNVPHETYSLVAADLNKSYYKSVKVIDHLSFTVNRGECFGLLGVNGAGKSTTFAMIATETRPDQGQVWLNGRYVMRDITAYRHQLGYDPQSNPELSLSAREAFYLMARLRRVHEPSIPMLVNSVLELLDMNEHADKHARELSGGTKRKLALGMALIGCPALIALDEPTAGIDPMARRAIWRLLRGLRSHNGTSIVISSHAMEECEAICDRISIMSNGRLRCIGTFLHLRSKFSQGCSLKVSFSGEHLQMHEVNAMIGETHSKLVSALGPSCALVDTNVNSATFKITDNAVRRSTIFKTMRELRLKYTSINYLINDSSLEDIFIAIAREQQSEQQQQQQQQQQQHELQQMPRAGARSPVSGGNARTQATDMVV